MRDKGDFLESVAEIPEPHAFTANVRIGQDTYPVTLRSTNTLKTLTLATTTCAPP
jgi:hypothetical protein